MLIKKILQRLWLLLLTLTVGGVDAWGYTGNAVVKMTYVDYNNPTTSYGEIAAGATAKSGYNSAESNYVNFANTSWGCNWLTFIQVNASTILGRITNATLTADISGSTDDKRVTTWGVGYNNETWSSTWTYNTADRHLIKVGSEVSSTSNNSGTFNNVSFDITNALKNDIDHIVNLVVYETAAAGGYIKNPAVTITYDAGWSVEEFSVSLTDLNDHNKKTTGMPTLFNPSGGAVTYSYSGAAGNLDQTYPPRLKATGDAIVTATVGGTDYTYTLHVTAPTGGGTYDAATNKYTFDQIGIIEQRSFTDVDGITMSINGGPTALVVQFGDFRVLKVIDANGYSLPNIGEGAVVVPYEGNYGGTFYKFVADADGTIYFEGNFVNAVWVKNGEVVKSSIWSTKEFTIEKGATYYLYNPDLDGDKASTPLLHSYRFERDKGLLKFKNPSATITVDLSEGSYTNEAVSGLGLPVTYVLSSGYNYASINSATGKVTFKKSELFDETFPLVITVKATTPAWGSYEATSISYDIRLTKTSWIFDDNDLWATSGSDLTSGWGSRSNYEHHNGDGTYHYTLQRRVTDEALTSDGTNELPETKGLKFTTDNIRDRLEIAPHGESPNYLAALNTTIAVENVKAGQTVTVDWYAARNTARLTMTDAADITTGELAQGISTLTATADGTVRLTFNATISYVRSIKISTPVRAMGTLTYAKTIMNPSETETRTGYTITDEETGADVKAAYGTPSNFRSSNTDVATVDASGNITAVGEGLTFISATASPLNSLTHQTATLTTMIEVTNASSLNSAQTRIRTINVEKLLYDVGEGGKSANDGLNRTIPGFTLTFEGGQGVKCNNEEKLTLRNRSGSQGVMNISTRMAPGKFAGIAKVRLTVSNLKDNPRVSYNHSGATETLDVTNHVLDLDGIYGEAVHITAIQGSFDISDIKIYYGGEAASIDNCLDDSKVAPVFNFPTQHYMRVPGDGRAFQNGTPTSSDPMNFRASEFTYTSSNTGIATIGRDGTGGHLISSGEATITATFDETDYFAQSTATYTVSNTLLSGESYDGLAMTTGQFIHVTAQASADNTTLTMENAATNLTYGTTLERRNSYVSSATSVNLKNETSESITVYSVDIITSNVKAWLYYEGQEENFSAQVQFTGFPTGPIAGFKVVDFGDINNPIDITDAYSYKVSSTFAIEAKPDYALLDNPGGTLPGGTTWYSGTGDAYAVSPGTSEIRRMLTKTGSADGYPDNDLKAISAVTVMQFDADHPVVWNFQNQVDNTGVSGEMGAQWSYTNPGTGRDKYYQTYFDSYMPILKNGEVAKDNNVGVLVNGDMRYYGGTPGLRLNLTKANAHIKFPVKENMEVVITLATSAADVTNIVHNVKSVKPPYNTTNTLYVEREGVNSPINGYFLAASDGAVTLDASDKVGVYIKSIRLQVPELHFEDEIATELTGSGSHTVNYQPYNAVEGHTLNYWVKDNKNYDFDDVQVADGHVATISDEQRHSGDVTLTSNEGWVTIYVEDPSATGVQPKKGEYKLYAVNFHFDPTTEAITLDANGEAVFNRRPVGYDKVKTPIDYTMTLGAGNPRGRIIQYTNESPALTTYRMTAYSTGTITVTATSGNATTSCVVTVGGLSFGDVAPVMSESDVKASNVLTNPLPSGWSASDSYTYQIDRSAYGDTKVECDDTPTFTTEGGVDVLKLGGLKGFGAIRVVVTNNTRGQTARFVLTLSYPASSRKKWSFFRFKDHNSQWGLEIGEIDTYNDYNHKKNNVSKTISGYNGTDASDTWTTSSTWSQIFRKGAELPRWGNDRSMKGDNAFYVQETAGLQIETGNQGFYVDQPARDPGNKWAYNHIGIHNNASITIPKLKEGDFVSLNLSRVIPNNGAILTGYNVTDLRGKPVTEQFTITRSQTEWEALNSDGSRFIPGYYTFIAHGQGSDAGKAEFDVTFELLDEGYLDVLSIEIYDGGIYKHTMTDVKLKDQNTTAPHLLLKEEDEEQAILLSYCHPLWSTSTGPCEYVLKGEQLPTSYSETYTEENKTECRYWVNATTTQKLKDGRKNLSLTIDHVKWLSAGGMEYEDGLLTVKEGYGKVVLRMNNYTVERRYLIGYTPDYVLNVGVKPHQDYPHTWNFTGISSGEVQGQAGNVYNSIKDDSPNWIKIANAGDVYQLNTDSKGASLYVPGGELVSTDRILGARGESPIAGRGFDELNGLGVDGNILFSTNTTAASAREMAKTPRRAASDANDLLTYSVTSTSTSVGSDISAGNGYINFGASKFESCTTAKSATGFTYKCDGGNTKYVLLKPQRAFEAGDVISIKAWSGNENGGLAFWTARTDVTGTVKLVTLSLTKINEEDLLTYTVTVDDGIEGLSQIYVYNSGTTSYFNAVTITRSTVPAGMTHNLYTASATTLTIPDLNADGKQDWIYISADTEPTAVTNATKVYEDGDNDGPDAQTDVYKYKATSTGNAYVTFASGTNIYEIGVTHILKDIHQVGGVGWATESRRHAIDHTLTGYFTVNNANAYTVSYDSYDLKTATVALRRVAENKGVPAKAGVVLKVDDASNLGKANLNTTNSLRRVPLFYPAVSTTVIPYNDMKFKPDGNMMMANLEARLMTHETDNGTLDDNEDATDDTGDDNGSYNRFMLTNVHWKYVVHTSYDDNAPAENRTWATIDDADAAGFHRLHIWTTSDPGVSYSQSRCDELNTMAANTAYLLVPTTQLPVALWDTFLPLSSRRWGSLGIREIDYTEPTSVPQLPVAPAGAEASETPASYYTLDGRRVATPRKGIYIRNGQKVVVK